MIIQSLLPLLFALGMLFGGAFAADHEAPAEPETPEVTEPVDDPADPAEPADPADPADPAAPEERDILTILFTNIELAEFAQTFELAMEERLDSTLEWTVFAPANSVLTEPGLIENQTVLATYIVEGAYTYDDLRQLAADHGGTATLTTLDGEEITVEVVDDVLLVAGVAQVTTQMEAANGFIYVIDALIHTPAVEEGAGGG